MTDAPTPHRPYRAFLALAGALPWIALYPLFHLFNLVASQVAWPRTLGLLGVFAAAFLVLAVPLSGAVLVLRADRPAWRRFWRLAFYALVLANLALVGLKVFWGNPRLAPLNAVLAVGAVIAVLFVAFWRYGGPEQAFVTRMLRGAGLVAIALPVLAVPVVIAAALQDVSRLPGAPEPVAKATPRAGAPKRIVLVTFDALRARSTSMVDPGRQLTPEMAAMAREATYYPNFYASSDRTLAAMPALLSGVGPEQVVPKLANRAGFGRTGFTSSLAGHLKGAGYHSVYATMLINPLMFGYLEEFDRGFTTSGLFHANRFNTRSFIPIGEAVTWLRERLSGQWTDMEPQANEVLGTRQTFDQARALLTANPDRAFAWVHLGAPHTPYYDVDPADLGGTLHPERYARVTQDAVPHGTAEQLARYEAIYERYIRFADHEFGRFRSALQADGLWDDALVIVTADHGEDFRPGLTLHGKGNLSEEVTHVPLLIHHPGQRRAERDDRVAGHLDLAPTVLAQVLSDVPKGFDGRRLDGPEDPAHIVYTWSLFNRYLDESGKDAAAAYHDGFKYLRENGVDHLYDLRQDPRAVEDVVARHPERLAHLKTKVLERFGP